MQHSGINKKWFGVLALFFMGLIVLQGCATAPRPTGYFAGDIELQPDPEDGSLLWWENPDFNWHHYSKVMLDPISVRIDAATVDRKFKPQEIASLSRDFKDAVAEKLGPERVATTPGPDVLRIRAAITDIDTSSPMLNLVTTAIAFVPMDMGGASIEVEFLDSVSGARLAAMADRKTGTPVQVISSFKRFGQTRAVFDQWAAELKSALASNP